MGKLILLKVGFVWRYLSFLYASLFLCILCHMRVGCLQEETPNEILKNTVIHVNILLHLYKNSLLFFNFFLNF